MKKISLIDFLEEGDVAYIKVSLIHHDMDKKRADVLLPNGYATWIGHDDLLQNEDQMSGTNVPSRRDERD